MAIDNNRSLLEQQILSNSGLKGKELENLKARLATLSEQQLQAELSKLLSGNNKGEWYTGITLEHSVSVVIKSNHETTTFTDENGNEISELRDGDEVFERTIKSTDDKGNVYITTVTFQSGKPLTQTKTKNGNTIETTTYRYNDDAEVPYVTVSTKKADKSKVMTNVLEVDENGNFESEDFIDRQITTVDGTTTHIFTENNCVIEQQVKPNGKKVDTIYKGDSIEDYDNKKLHRVYQRTELNGEVHEVAYDGNGNTRTVVQNGESPSAIAKKFGVKESSLLKLNPAKGKNAITQVGADIVVPGEYNADSSIMKTRKTKQGTMQDYANDEVQRTVERLYSSTMQEVTLDKDYKDAYSYARALLVADGIKNPSNQQINNKANEILVANGNIKFTKGTKVQIAAKTANSKLVQDLSNNGFKPTRENAIFYNRFNALNPSQQQNVLSVIKYCRSQKITDPNKIKARILETFPEINLFDSGKLIPMNSSFGTPAFRRKNPVALETFLTDTLKLDLKSETGKMVYERLSSLSQDELNKIDGHNFADMSKANFNEIANSFETSGINIRTGIENQIEQNARVQRAERLGIPQQKFTSEMLANIYDRAADMLEQYYHNHGIFDAGTYPEGMKNLMDLVTPDNIFGIDMRSTLHVASDCRKAAQRFRQMHTDNPETFKREYEQLKTDGLVTADYNRQNVQEFMNLIQSGEVDINSDKFKNACQKAFGFKGVENTEKYIQTGEMAGNIGDIVIMLYTLGAASELKMMGKATTGVYGALERGAGKIMGKTAAQKTAKVGTSMLMGGTTLGGFTLGKETLNNLSNPMRDATSWETWKQTGIASAESFEFGFVGGLLNETVVAPIVKAIEKPATKATQAVSKALTEQGELTGKQIMEAVSESGSLKLDGLFKMNSQEWANLARTATAKGVGFGVEVTGFTAYEAGLDTIKDLIDPQTGRLPDNITVETLADYLGEKFGEQFSNLGTIKGIAQLLMMSKGGKLAQKAMMNEILSKSEALKDIKFKKAEINGHEVYEVTYPNGNRAVVSSPEQAIATCQMAMQMEFLAKSFNEVKIKQQTTAEVRTPDVKPDGTEQNPLLTRLETSNDRESFVAIRDEIKKMPNGEEKTKLMQTYLKKYNEWSADPSRPDIRMQYIPEENNVQNNLVEYQTFDDLLKHAPRAEIKVEEMDEFLRLRGYSEEDITKLKNALGNDYAKYVNIGKFAVEVFGERGQFKGVEDIIENYNCIPEESKPLMELLNRTSIEFLSTKLCISTEEVLEILFAGDGGHLEIAGKCYNLSRKTGVSIRDINKSIGNNQEKLLDKITPEQVLAYKNVSDILELDSFGYGAIEEIVAIKNPEKITKEFLEDYRDTIDRFAELGIYGYEGGTDPVEQLTKLKAIERQLKDNNIDLSWYADAELNHGRKIYLGQLENILQSKDISKISDFLSSCSDECKYNHAEDILQFAQDCYVNNPKAFAEMLNTIDKVTNGYGAFWGLRSRIDKHIENGTFDIEGVKEVAQAFIDTGLFVKNDPSAYAFFATDYSTNKPNYKGMAKFIRELKEFYNENSEYQIEAYMQEVWRGGHFDTMQKRFKQLKELGLYGKVAPSDLRCLLEEANNENVFNLIVAFHDEPLVKNEIFYYDKSSVEVLSKRIDNLKQIIEESNTEYNNLSLNEKIELIRELNERNEFYGFLRPHFSDVNAMNINKLVEGKQDFALQIFNNPQYKSTNLSMADRVALFRESNKNNESNILNLITRFKDAKRCNNVFTTRGLILQILRSEKSNWLMSQNINDLDNFVSELYDKSMKNREEFVNNSNDNSDTVEFFRRSYCQLILLTANSSKEGVENLLKTKHIPDSNEYLNNFNSFDKSEMDLFKKMYSSEKPEQIAEIIDVIEFLKTDIKEMYLGSKIKLLEKISHVSDEILDKCRKYSDINIDAKIEELTISLGKKREVVTIPFEQQQLFVKNVLANNNPNVENILKTFDFEQYEKKGLPLEYPREKFTANIENIIQDLSAEEQILVLSHFGLERGEAGFDGLPTNKTFDNPKASPKVNKVAKLVQAEIEKFTTHNKIKIGDRVANEVLNGLIQGLPEFTSIVGKEQHGTHAYSVDIHTLKVLQSAMNNPLYEKLSDRDKTILKISALCHDFGKRGGVVDEGHANLSAEYVAGILAKFPFPQGMKDRIIDIVENHHWFEKYNTGSATAEDIAVRCRRPEDFIIYEILAKADFENVNETFHIERSDGVNSQAEFNRFMQEKMVAIDKALALIYSKSNLIFDTQFMQNGERFPRESVVIDGEQSELKVLNLNNLQDNANLQQYGFSTGVTKDNARFTVHMTYPSKSNMESVTILTQNSMNNSAWSTSLIKTSNNRTYGNEKFGFILDVDQANISEAYYENTGSGCGKDINVFKTILFEQDNAARTYVKNHLMQDLLKKGIQLSNDEYVQLSKFLMSKKYTTQITKDVKIGNRVIKASDLVECLESSRDALFFGGDQHSEIVSINPRVKGLIAKVEKLEDCPEEFLQFAQKHNLPIILMKPTKEQ